MYHTLKIMDERNEMLLQSSVDMQKYRGLNRQVSKSFRTDLRTFNTSRIKDAIERNKGYKVFARDLSVGQTQLMKLKTENGNGPCVVVYKTG